MTHSGWRLVTAALLGVLVTPAVALPAQSSPPPVAKRAAAPKVSFEQLAQKARDARAAKKLDEAIRFYKQALVIRPSWTEGQWGLGTLLYEVDRFEEARDAFRRVAEEQPNDGVVLALKGLCEFRLKNYDRALADLKGARALRVSVADVASVSEFHTALLFIRYEKYENAFEILTSFARKGEDSQAVIEAFGLCTLRMPYLPSEAPVEKRELILLAGRAGFYTSDGRRSVAADLAFEELLSRFPTTANVHYSRGLYLLRDDPDLAHEEFRTELRLFPGHVPAMLQLSFDLLKRGDHAEALAFARRAAEVEPRNFAIYNALGRSLLEAGETDEAIKALEQGAKLAPESPQMQFALARAYARAGRTEESARARAEFLRLDKAARAMMTGPQSVGGTGAERHEDGPRTEEVP